jgi:hypothetical protein
MPWRPLEPRPPGDPWSRGHLETPGAAAAGGLQPRPLAWSSAGDTSRLHPRSQARDIEARGRRPRSRARVRDIFRVCEGRTGRPISAGGYFAKPRVLCINVKLGGRFAKFAQMQNHWSPLFVVFFANYQMQNWPLDMLLDATQML